MDKSKRNSLAGSTTGKSASAKYYQNNPKARAKKNAYNKDYHSTPARKRYRSELNKANKEAGTYGNKDRKDMSHKKNGSMVKESQSKNRARQGANGRSTKK